MLVINIYYESEKNCFSNLKIIIILKYQLNVTSSIIVSVHL